MKRIYFFNLIILFTSLQTYAGICTGHCKAKYGRGTSITNVCATGCLQFNISLRDIIYEYGRPQSKDEQRSFLNEALSSCKENSYGWNRYRECRGLNCNGAHSKGCYKEYITAWKKYRL